jgi:hypothetical protein
LKVLNIILVAAIVAVGALSNVAMADQFVNGYYRNGTYVQPYWRSSPNRSYNDNWSVSPNYNPYTGRRGTLSPTYNDRAPTLCTQLFGCY